MCSPLSRNELFLFDVLRSDQLQKRVSEPARILSVVVAGLEFIQVAVQMLVRPLMERADDASLEQTASAFNAFLRTAPRTYFFAEWFIV